MIHIMHILKGKFCFYICARESPEVKCILTADPIYAFCAQVLFYNISQRQSGIRHCLKERGGFLSFTQSLEGFLHTNSHLT